MTRIAVQSLECGAADAARLAVRLGVPAHTVDVHRFPDGELRVTVGPAAPTTILYASLDQPNDKLITLLFAAEALRRGGARRLVLVAPYLCYMRQDTAFSPGEAISQTVIGRLLAGAFDRVVTVDAHLHRTPSLDAILPGIESLNLSAVPAIAEGLTAAGYDPRTIVVGPDAESEPWARDLGSRLGVDHMVASKTRQGDRSVAITLPDAGAISGRPVILFDDIVSSGGTIIACAKALLAVGATRVEVIVTHALFLRAILGDFAQAGISSVRSTSSVPHPTNAIPLDGLLASALAGELDRKD
ncbi:MAG: ribose-phosphate pyrophosphokinase [Xanthobacteraceae bacterium]|nr:MAG: ribose-phosphate pyrophosphokinase [Xanthobacteraceae bacterium]